VSLVRVPVGFEAPAIHTDSTSVKVPLICVFFSVSNIAFNIYHNIRIWYSDVFISGLQVISIWATAGQISTLKLGMLAVSVQVGIKIEILVQTNCIRKTITEIQIKNLRFQLLVV
jgi:hypothetical protein